MAQRRRGEAEQQGEGWREGEQRVENERKGELLKKKEIAIRQGHSPRAFVLTSISYTMESQKAQTTWVRVACVKPHTRAQSMDGHNGANTTPLQWCPKGGKFEFGRKLVPLPETLTLKFTSARVLGGTPYSQCRLHALSVSTLRRLGQPQHCIMGLVGFRIVQ